MNIFCLDTPVSKEMNCSYSKLGQAQEATKKLIKSCFGRMSNSDNPDIFNRN
jgi:hypothetical protein